MAENLNLPTDQGVLVQRATGPARKAGVKGGDTQVSIGGADILLGGDVMVAIDGKKVRSMDDVIGVVNSKKPGDEVTLELRRGDQKRSVKVKLGDRPASADSSLQAPGRTADTALESAKALWRRAPPAPLSLARFLPPLPRRQVCRCPFSGSPTRWGVSRSASRCSR